MENIKQFLSSLPSQPGVYQMIDKNKNIIYIGKAKDLSKRVPSYFRKTLNRNNQIEKMVTLIDDIKIIITNNEVEALILENNLIKELKPKYNTLLKDDKSYPYIEITLEEEFPRIVLSKNISNKKSKYFGPFPDIEAAKQTIELLKNLYKIRNCDSVSIPKKDCLYYQIHKCDAPCIGKIDKKTYDLNIDKVIDFMNGNTSSIKKELKEKMTKFAENMEFEKAGEIRDLLSNIDKIFKKQIINTTDDDKDVVGIFTKEDETVIVVFLVRNGKIINKKDYTLKNQETNENNILLSKFLERYYINELNLPKTILVGEDIENKDVLEEALTQLKGYKIKINKPLKGDNLKLIDLAVRNAELIINENSRKKQLKILMETKSVNELKTMTGISEINRIESFDISHLAGTFTVGSMIVFENNKLNKKAYRKFRLEDKNDDFNSLKDMLKRRFTDENLLKTMPSLLLIDGGPEQVSKILELLEELSLSIPVVGMVKNYKHQTDHLFYNKEDISFDKFQNAFKLVCNIQDETHNFAINYNRNLRNKETSKSILDDIPGIGQSKKKLLLNEFGSVDEIKNKTVEELSKIKGIDKKIAENILDFLNKEV